MPKRKKFYRVIIKKKYPNGNVLYFLGYLKIDGGDLILHKQIDPVPDEKVDVEIEVR